MALLGGGVALKFPWSFRRAAELGVAFCGNEQMQFPNGVFCSLKSIFFGKGEEKEKQNDKKTGGKMMMTNLQILNLLAFGNDDDDDDDDDQ